MVLVVITDYWSAFDSLHSSISYIAQNLGIAGPFLFVLI